jgi:hypothetical protein
VKKYTDKEAVAAITAIVNAAPRKRVKLEDIKQANAEFWPSPPIGAGKPDIAMLGRLLNDVHGAEQKARGIKIAKPATAGRKKMGDTTRDKVRSEARKLPRNTKRVNAAGVIAPLVYRSVDTVITILKKDRLFSRRK